MVVEPVILLTSKPCQYDDIDSFTTNFDDRLLPPLSTILQRQITANMAPGAIDTTDNPTNQTFSQHVPSNQIPALFSLRNKTIAITGGGRGLGLTLAFAVVEAGGHAALLDLLPEPSEPEYSALTRLAKQSGLTVTYHSCDVTSEADVTSVLDAIEGSGSKLGAPLGGMIACAGIQQRVPALDYSSADFERILRVNVVGAFISVKHTAKILQQNDRHGSIVLIASMSGQVANRGLTCTAYNSSKSAVQQMCRSLAQEWGQFGIRVNTLSPGVGIACQLGEGRS
jgi:NAD(P)-dependent dehydrogenase (short-subunit alcohol dehydrogenase family)